MSAAAESLGMSASTSQASSSVNTLTPPSATTSSAPAMAPASIPSSPSIPRPIRAPIMLPTSIASCSVRLLRCSTSISPIEAEAHHPARAMFRHGGGRLVLKQVDHSQVGQPVEGELHGQRREQEAEHLLRHQHAVPIQVLAHPVGTP